MKEELTHSQVRRRDFLLGLLEGQPGVDAKKALGITGRKFETRLKASLQRDCSLADAPRSGRPPIYTPDILDDAQDWFFRNDWRLLKKSDLVTELQELDILSDDATVRGFYAAFEAHLSCQGYNLKWGARSLSFALSHEHEIQRYEWCQLHQCTFASENLWDYWFEDEIIVEEGGHPKGMWAVQGMTAAYSLSHASE